MECLSYFPFKYLLAKSTLPLLLPAIVLILISNGKTTRVAPTSETNPDENGKTFEGDISMGNGTVLKVGSDDVITKPVLLWDRRTIPYKFSSQFDDAKIKIVRGAMAEISRETCIVFKRRKRQRDYIYIQLGRTCESNVGRNTGKQNVTLIASLNPRSNCVEHGEVLHELMHAIGFWHEQSRPDRDNYVNIRYAFMRKSASKMNFNKHMNQWDFQLPYDYSSVLHYSKDAFQKYPSSITIVPLVFNHAWSGKRHFDQNANGSERLHFHFHSNWNSQTCPLLALKICQLKRLISFFIKGAPIGMRNHLSHFDKVKINMLYKCGGEHDVSGVQTSRVNL